MVFLQRNLFIFMLLAGSMVRNVIAFLPGNNWFFPFKKNGIDGKSFGCSTRILGNDVGSFSLSSVSPSKIVDLDDPTPEKPPYEPPIVDAEDIEKLMEYDESNFVVPHQPWRRGNLNGCGDPVDAQWRLEAEYIMEQAAKKVGGYVEDITWYTTFCVVTLGSNLRNVFVEIDGEDSTLASAPAIRVDGTSPNANVYFDGPRNENDPSEKELGAFAGEENARSPNEEDEDEDDEDDYEPKYDEQTGEELSRGKRRPTRTQAIFAYQNEREEKAAQKAIADLTIRLPGSLEPKDLKVEAQEKYKGYVKYIDDFESLLEEKYGFSLSLPCKYQTIVKAEDEDPNEDKKLYMDSTGMTESDFESALKICNLGWGLKPAELDEYKQYILEKYDVVKKYKDVDLEEELDEMEVRGDGITDDYANRLSIVGQAIFDALICDDVDAKLDVIDRHEIILTSTNFDPRVVETQKEFDSARGKDVYVHTRDPWESNRILKGKLVDRNVLDVVINQKGRMVTVPNNMIEIVKLPDSTNMKRSEEMMSTTTTTANQKGIAQVLLGMDLDEDHHDVGEEEEYEDVHDYDYEEDSEEYEEVYGVTAEEDVA